MATLKSWFKAGESLERIKNALTSTHHTIRIATAYFSVSGWNYIRSLTKNRKVYILVSCEDLTVERTRTVLIKEILWDLRRGINIGRRQAVEDLVSKIKSEEFGIVDARSINHHNKLYIFDDFQAIQTSSNLTKNGLTQQVEGGTVITHKKEIKALIQEFDYYFELAKDLTEELLAVLEKWLEFAIPWDIYLKTMFCLENIEIPSSCYQKEPTLYQKDMIARSLRQIKEYGGSMLIASTGLGKTIVGVYVALKLKEEKLIDNVVIICPKAVESKWNEEMFEASLPCHILLPQNLDKSGPEKDRKLYKYEQIIKNIANQKTLLIIDECHEFRNRYKIENFWDTSDQRTDKRRVQRVRQMIDSGNVKTLLLTASPYATELDNVNNQLYLIPHTASSSSSYFADQLPNYAHLFQKAEAKAWRIDNLDQLKDLPVISQLTTPYIAKNYATREDNNYSLMFKDEKRYIPHVRLYHIQFPLPLQAEMSQVISDGLFHIQSKIYKKSFNTFIKLSWSSSPSALEKMLQAISDTPGGMCAYKANFVHTRSLRKKRLQPIIESLNDLIEQGDTKVKVLLEIINDIVARQQKAIIYCERRFTVLYILIHLKQRFPLLKIACTIEHSSDDGEAKMKNARHIDKMIKDFAPIANDTEDIGNEYDVFLSTDTHGVGINMQDASVVINYDISWTPINPIQRAGRILRFWHLPRTIEVYTFVPTSQENIVKLELADVNTRWRNLMKRHNESSKMVEMPVLTNKSLENIILSELSSQVTVESGMMDIDNLASVDISDYYQHTSNLQFNRDYADTLPDDLISARLYDQDYPSLYLLLCCNNEYYPVMYDVNQKKIIEPEIVELLSIIACPQNTPIAIVDFDMVEKVSNQCLKQWCHYKNLDPEDVERICTLYLEPKVKQDNLKTLFNQIL